MAYLGRGIENLSDRVVLDALTASATASYTLQLNSVNFVPSSASSLTVSLNGVIQKPDSSYTVSGSTLTFSSALTSSDSIDFIIAERGITLQTPSAGSVNTDQLAATAVTNAKIANSTIEVGKVASSLKNTPSFSAQLSSAQSIANNTSVTIVFDTENHDTDNAYNTSTGIFTVPSGKGGKYFFTSHFRLNSTSDSSRLALFLQVNGNTKATYNNVQRDEDSTGVSLVIDLNAGDEVKSVIFQNTGGTHNSKTADNVMFMGFRLIGD